MRRSTPLPRSSLHSAQPRYISNVTFAKAVGVGCRLFRLTACRGLQRHRVARQRGSVSGRDHRPRTIASLCAAAGRAGAPNAISRPRRTWCGFIRAPAGTRAGPPFPVR
jgi:hypothetical protein